MTNIPLAISERQFTRYQFLPFIQGRIAGFVNPDFEWCGGISEAKKIASLAETYQLPVSLHDYGGPILNFASAHVSANIPNMALMETGRNLIANWTECIISKPIVIDDGYMLLPDGPGLGVSLAESFLRRDDLHRYIV